MRALQGARRASLFGVVLLVGVMAYAPTLRAQVVSGTVRDSATQLPLPNTRVLVLDASGRPAAQSTTDPAGRFHVSPWASKGAGRSGAALRLRVVRMGFRPREFPLPRVAEASSLDIAIASFPITLEEVQVTAATCPKRPDRAAALAVLREVRMAVFATVLARSQGSATVKRLLYERRLERQTGRVLGQSVRAKVTTATGEPFSAARSAMVFGREGFARDSAGEHTYVGPDAESLIDDEFVQNNCFRITAPDRARPGQVGLGFEPVEREDGRIDIVGTLWVDTLSRVLQDLNFRYVGLDRETSALQPEGRLSFRELPNGIVIIDEWSLRLVGDRNQPGGATPEIGGEVARVSWPDGYSWSAPLGTARIRAVDAQGRPAVSTTVQLVGTDYSVTMDSSGVVVLGDLLPGPYTATVRDERLVALGVPSSTTLRFTAMRDSTKEALLQVETAEDVMRKRCGQDQPVSGKSWLLGRVVTTDGRAVKEARWSIRDQFGTPLVEDGRVDTDGFLHSCQVPLNSRVTIDVWRDDRRLNDSRIVMGPLTTLHFVLP
jgi:hypothetical protein